jgi:hypothetical protein
VSIAARAGSVISAASAGAGHAAVRAARIHRIALLEGSYPSSSAQWCVIRDYGMYDRRQATGTTAGRAAI